MRLKFVTYATPEFIESLGHWLATVQGHGLDYHYEKIKDRGSWRVNCAYRGDWIYDRAQEFKDDYDANVWIDADGLVLKYPQLLFDLTTDVAWHSTKGSPMAGTMFFRLNNDGLRFLELLRKWSSRLDGKRPILLEAALVSAYDECAASHTELPKEYCCFYREVPGMEELVIAHFRDGKRR